MDSELQPRKIDGIVPWGRHDQFFIVNNLSNLSLWDENQGFETRAAVIGCGAYGKNLCMNEIGWVSQQIDTVAKGVIFGIDPGMNNLLARYNPAFEKVKYIGSPNLVNNNPVLRVALINAYSGSVGLSEALDHSLNNVLIVAPEPSAAAGIIADAISFTKKDGLITVIFEMSDFMVIGDKEIDDITPANILNSINTMHQWDPEKTSKLSLSKFAQLAQRSRLTHFGFDEYWEQGYPTTPKFNSVNSRDALLTVLNIQV